MAAVLQFQQERGAGVRGVVGANQGVAQDAERAVLRAQHPQRGHRQVRVQGRRAGHRDHRFETRVAIRRPVGGEGAEGHAGDGGVVRIDPAGEARVAALVPADHLVEQEAHVERPVFGGVEPLAGLRGDDLAVDDRPAGVARVVRPRR